VTSRPLLLGSEKRHYDKSPGEIDLGTPIGGEFKLPAAVRMARATMLPTVACTGAPAVTGYGLSEYLDQIVDVRRVGDDVT